MIKARWWVLALAAYGSGLGAQTQTAVPSLTAAERAAGWRLLFDGRTLAGWRGLGYDSVPTAHWQVDAGTIKKIASGNVPKLPDGQPLYGGDLMTVDTFGDFELTWEWKVTPGANSGLKYNVSEELSVKEAPNHGRWDSNIRSWTMTGTWTASWRRIAPAPCTTSSRRAGPRMSILWASGTSLCSSSGATTASTG